MTLPWRLLIVGVPPKGLAASAWGPFEIDACGDLEAARERLATLRFDGLLLVLPAGDEARRLLSWTALSQAVQGAAVVVATGRPDAALAGALLERGVQDVVALAEASTEALARAMHLALLRKRIEHQARSAHVTDLATGLPNQTQLLEHMDHLLALREREPAPMALLLVRIEGLATAQASLGAAAAGVLRRKLAVRLRASLRASDVVASVGADAFAALLAWIDAPEAAERVAAKLTLALTVPLQIGTGETAVGVSIGIAHYPAHGRQAETLLQQAFAQAAGGVALGRAGFANIVERGASDAANDEAPPA
ncbi:MAG: GGDEF domain-containing protein [Methylibium sp.]|uniref:GGDEF domain-containing protein n=1 Tax=Methylibium sp. TaxID=2067992 RepID=UPI001815DED3|nr:GGDEF domain-containing protein [Methylibium sp.]MBA2722257.1 GGDEF domain-containing protein [Methylibium sp.]MBA3589934.1 GGDEF domain-containing protein [Methylibium sp.]